MKHDLSILEMSPSALPNVADLTDQVARTQGYYYGGGGFADIYRGQWQDMKMGRSVEVQAYLLVL